MLDNVGYGCGFDVQSDCANNFVVHENVEVKQTSACAYLTIFNEQQLLTLTVRGVMLTT